MQTKIVGLICLFAVFVMVFLAGNTIAAEDYVPLYNLDKFRNSVVLVICKEPGNRYQFFGNSVVVSVSHSETLLLSARHLISTGCQPYAHIGGTEVSLEIKKVSEGEIDLVLFSFPYSLKGLRPVLLDGTSRKQGSVFALAYQLTREEGEQTFVSRKGRLYFLSDEEKRYAYMEGFSDVPEGFSGGGVFSLRSFQGILIQKRVSKMGTFMVYVPIEAIRSFLGSFLGLK